MIMGWKKLNKKELDHLKNNGVNSTALFQLVVNDMEKMRSIQRSHHNGDVPIEPCWECKHIAEKLGFIPSLK